MEMCLTGLGQKRSQTQWCFIKLHLVTFACFLTLCRVKLKQQVTKWNYYFKLIITLTDKEKSL